MKPLKNFWVGFVEAPDEIAGLEMFGFRLWIYPTVHSPENVALLKARGLHCLRPGCGCTEWWG